MLDRVGEARQAVAVEDHLARQVPTDIATAQHGNAPFSATSSSRTSLRI
jgi:hypothetical protein